MKPVQVHRIIRRALRSPLEILGYQPINSSQALWANEDRQVRLKFSTVGWTSEIGSRLTIEDEVGGRWVGRPLDRLAAPRRNQVRAMNQRVVFKLPKLDPMRSRNPDDWSYHTWAKLKQQPLAVPRHPWLHYYDVPDIEAIAQFLVEVLPDLLQN